MKGKHIEAYIKTAWNFAECSTAVRLKVGCVIVKNLTIISIGYNGTPSGWDNTCETETLWLDGKQMPSPVTVTKPEVLHAEANAISKLAKGGGGGEGASLFTTHSPCFECSKLIYQVGIVEVFYSEEYRDRKGVDFLEKCGIKVKNLLI